MNNIHSCCNWILCFMSSFMFSPWLRNSWVFNIRYPTIKKKTILLNKVRSDPFGVTWFAFLFLHWLAHYTLSNLNNWFLYVFSHPAHFLFLNSKMFCQLSERASSVYQFHMSGIWTWQKFQKSCFITQVLQCSRILFLKKSATIWWCSG